MDKNRRYQFAIVGFIGLLLFIHLLHFIWFPFLPYFEQRDAGEQIVKEQMDADEALENYRWFRQQWQNIQAQRDQIENFYDQEEQFYELYGKDPSEWDRTTKERHSRIQNRIAGSQNMLEQMVADYNARSQDATRDIFKCHLPYQVDERFAIQGPPGSDAPEQPDDKYVDGTSAGSPPPAEECDQLPDQIREEAEN